MAKKNNTAEKTILEAEQITKALKEGTEKQLRNLMNEALSNLIKEDENQEEIEEPVEDDSYEVEDVDAENSSEDETPEGTDSTDSTEEGESLADNAENADDEWSDMEEFKVGDNDYDFTGVDGETALKVYNKLNDDDEIFVTKDEDGNYEMRDDETGAEYVIELNPDGDDAEAEFEVELGDDESEDADSEDDDSEIEIDFDDEPEEDDTEIEIDLGDDDQELGDNEELEDPELNDDEDDELNEENLGYTDSYQKDVFTNKPNMSEPAKGMNDWDNGAPKGAEKPWAGKGDMKPFGKQKQEVDEQVVLGSEANNRKKVKSAVKRQAKTGYHTVSQDGEYKGDINEAKIRKIVEAAKAIQAENKLYKESIEKIKKSLYEAAVLNVNLGKVVSLLVNETTTREEKNSILERFNNVKTIKEGNALFESIRRELKGSTQKSAIMERQISMAPSLNETTIYTQSNPSLDMMARMDNLSSYYKK